MCWHNPEHLYGGRKSLMLAQESYKSTVKHFHTTLPGERLPLGAPEHGKMAFWLRSSVDVSCVSGWAELYVSGQRAGGVAGTQHLCWI